MRTSGSIYWISLFISLCGQNISPNYKNHWCNFSKIIMSFTEETSLQIQGHICVQLVSTRCNSLYVKQHNSSSKALKIINYCFIMCTITAKSFGKDTNITFSHSLLLQGRLKYLNSCNNSVFELLALCLVGGQMWIHKFCQHFGPDVEWQHIRKNCTVLEKLQITLKQQTWLYMTPNLLLFITKKKKKKRNRQRGSLSDGTHMS